jgi:hypothetical protein
MGNELSMWIQESITVSTLRSGQDTSIFHQNFADPHGFEGEVKTTSQGYTKGIAFSMYFGGGGQQIQLRTEGRENGDLGGSSPLVRGSTQFANE